MERHNIEKTICNSLDKDHFVQLMVAFKSDVNFQAQCRNDSGQPRFLGLCWCVCMCVCNGLLECVSALNQ